VGPIAILVPVLGRPQNVQPFMESTAVTKEDYNVYFICSPNDHDQIRECEQSGANVMVISYKPLGGDFARKINHAFDETEEDWVFQGADDIRFSLNWDLHAFRVAQRTRMGVIGTNDLGNPDVIRGRSSTHTLIRRSYIEEFGSGTFDNTGSIFCELYDHQYVDVEFVQTAKFRKQFAFAKNSVVEHLHPHWGKAKMDPTYEKATRRTQRDMQLYKDRLIGIKNQTLVERRSRR